MKKILTLAFLLLGLQQLSAQTLPFYDLSYYDSPECAKEQANKFAKNTMTKPDEAMGKTLCRLAKAFEEPSREAFAKRWNAIPSEVRWNCINGLENAQKTGRIPSNDDGMLDSCINELTKK